MAKKQLGYVEMEWVCPRCGSKNPGPQKTCTNCGGPQPKEVKFQQREGQQLIKERRPKKSRRLHRMCTVGSAAHVTKPTHWSVFNAVRTSKRVQNASQGKWWVLSVQRQYPTALAQPAGSPTQPAR